MRKIAFALLTLGLVATATPSMAASLLFDTFSYPNGNLAPNGGWAVFSGAATDIQVNAGRAEGFGPNANDDHRLFAAQSLTQSTYACFDVTIPQFSGAPKPIYFAMLKDAGTSLFVARTYVLPTVAGGMTFGISTTSTGATAGVTPWTAPILPNTNYKLVIKYDPVAKSATLWVDPVSEASPSVTDVNLTPAAIGVAGFGLRQSASASTFPAGTVPAGTADWGFSVDNLGVGVSFADACEIPTPAEPATWGGIKGIYR